MSARDAPHLGRAPLRRLGRGAAARLADGWPTQHRSEPSDRTAVPAFDAAGVDGQFQRDRARIIHSSSFRALQSKTQVLGLGESDFYRTRLTHSLEVAQIGSGICESLRASADRTRRCGR